jgi:hypothetical protein
MDMNEKLWKEFLKTPQTKKEKETLGEAVVAVVKEETDNFEVPPEMQKDLEGPLPSPEDTEEKNLQKAIRAIEAEGYDYEIRGKNTIIIKDDDRLETLEKIKSMLIPQGFRHNPTGGGSSIGRLEILDKVLGNVYILIKPKSRRAAATAGMDFEDKMAQLINDKYGSMGVEASTAGFGPGSDLTIKTPTKTITAELKTALSADFGQFRAQFNQESNSWEPRRTAGYVKNEEIFNPLFEQYLKDWLNANATFPNPADPRLRKDDKKITGLVRSEKTGDLKKELQNNWFNGRTDYKVDFPFEMIASYYADKGDEYIQINGRGLYALTPEAAEKLGVPMFEDLGLVSYLRFRFKPSQGINSATSFTVAVKLKGKYKNSNLSLTNADDLDTIIKKLL